MTQPAWMTKGADPQPPGPPPPPPPLNRSPVGGAWRDVDEIATAAVLQQQDTDLQAALEQQRCI